MAPTELDLKGMNGTAPTASMASRFRLDRYALSAEISLTSKFWAVVLVRPGSRRQSPSLDTLAAVTTEHKALIDQAAKLAGISISSWMVDRLLKIAREELKRPG